MPRMFLDVSSQQKADIIKKDIPLIVKALHRPPESIEFYFRINPGIKGEMCLVFLHDLPERASAEYRNRLKESIAAITCVKEIKLIFVDKYNWVMKQDVARLCR